MITASGTTGERFLPWSPLARWAVTFFVLFMLLLDLTPLFRFEAGGVFATIDRVTGPAAWASITLAVVCGLLAALRSRRRVLRHVLATGFGRAAFGLAAVAVIATAVGPAAGNFGLYLLGGAGVFVAVLMGAFAVFRAEGQRVSFLPRTASGVWSLCLSVAAIGSVVSSWFVPLEAAPMVLARTVTQLGVLLWSPAAAAGLVAVLHYRERSVPVVVLTALLATGASFWLLTEFVFSGA
ncbi:MAG: hypothetical protein ACLGH7_12560 [Actinomycetes bacterium]